eukprot:1819054-Pyramimonas_sp.AAC.1
MLTSLFRAAQSSGPRTPPKRQWFKWGKGPISDTIAWVREGGWAFKSPSVVADRLGIGIELNVISPVFVAKEVRITI